MRAWLVRKWGEPDEMELADIPEPRPASGQVRIRIRAAALNYFDVLQIRGQYQVKPPFPFTPGAEIAGVIDAVGDGADIWRKGDHVIAVPQLGGFAECALANSCDVLPLPGGMEWRQAAAMPIVFHTSFFALRDRAAIRKGEWLLVHAGASGVGMSAIQLGRAFGARVIATAGSPEKLRFAHRQGAEHVVNYASPSWVDEVREITGGRGADVVYDPVGSDVFDLSTKCIASGGRLLVIGFAGGRIPSIAANRVLLKNISVVGVYWGGEVRARSTYLVEVHRELDSLWHAGKIAPEVCREWPLGELPAALSALAHREITGKAVVVPDYETSHRP
ncbi:MAG TPA: NADPH:quinone oxidoreductase family protein [Bryobacteraceae bacterium]|nr:NADPH:quinone oxidoreductase family protein [Bryobacteraceae bacterium]